MTTKSDLEQMVDLMGLRQVMHMLSVICVAKTFELAKTNAREANQWSKHADALDSAIVKMWGRL